MIIYKITNTVNNKVYIGQTKHSLSKRKHQHKYNKSTAIGAAIRKYGQDNFIFEVLEQCFSHDHMNEREIFWIKEYDCLAPKGYNLVSGGFSREEMSEETREKYKKINLGRKRTEETRNRIRIAKLGKKATEEHVQKQREGMKKRYSEYCHHMLGKTLSEETRKKIGESNKRSMLLNKNGKYGKGKMHTEESKNLIREALKQRWSNPKTRQKLLDAFSTKPPQTEEAKQKRAESIRKTLARKKERQMYATYFAL
jgi:group I intron endonuclease